MSFFRDISPTGAFRDLRELWFGDRPYKWHFLVAALIATTTIFTAFFNESGFEKEYKPPEIHWVTNLDPNRTDAEIRRDIEEQEVAKQKRLADLRAREEERRAQYKRLAEQLGMDTE